MFRRFCQIFSKKLQKVAHFVKNEKSSIWQNFEKSSIFRKKSKSTFRNEKFGQQATMSLHEKFR